MEAARSFGTLALVAAIVFAIVLLVCWIVLPLALIGTKPLLRELIREQRRTNELLAQRSRDK